MELQCEGTVTSLTADQIIVATPAYRAAEFLGNIDSELSNELNAIEYASSAVAITMHRLSDIKHPMDAFGMVIPKIENRRILAVSFPSRKFPDRAPEEAIQLRTFIGGALQPEVLEHSDNDILRIVQAELKEIFDVTSEPLHAILSRHQRSMPQYHVGHLSRVRRIRNRERALSNIHLAGNAYDGVGIPDCIASGESAAEQAVNLNA